MLSSLSNKCNSRCVWGLSDRYCLYPFLFLSDVIVCCQQGRMLITTIIEWESARSMVQRMRIHHFNSPDSSVFPKFLGVRKKVSYITTDDCCEWCFVRQRQPTTDGGMMGQRGLVRFEKWQKQWLHKHASDTRCDGWWDKTWLEKLVMARPDLDCLPENDRKGNIKF